MTTTYLKEMPDYRFDNQAFLLVLSRQGNNILT